MTSSVNDASSPGLLVAVVGQISSGKSSLVSALGDLTGWKTFLEPTATNPWLAKFYSDPKKYALPMQLYMLKKRYHTYLEALRCVLRGESVILDRSIFDDWVFAEKNRVDGNIDESGFAHYMQLRDSMLAGLPMPSCTLYLKVSPEEAHRRIHQLRQREAETAGSGIPLPYLQGLDTCYEDLVQQMEQLNAFVLRLDWNKFGEASPVHERIRSRVASDTEAWDVEGVSQVVTTKLAEVSAAVKAEQLKVALDEANALERCAHQAERRVSRSALVSHSSSE